MVLYSFAEPMDNEFAHAIRTGTWADGPSGQSVLVSPVVIEWQPGSKRLADLTVLPIGGGVVATQDIVNFLRIHGVSGFLEGQVKVERTSQNRRIPPPEFDDQIVELIPHYLVECDLTRSTVRRMWQQDGENVYEFGGLEYFDPQYDPIERKLIRKRKSRQPGEGILISTERLDGLQVFRVKQAPSLFCCTADFKGLLEENGISNVEFLEIGETY